MRLDINLTDDQIDEITMHSLRDAYKLNIQPIRYDNSEDTIPVDQEFLDAVDLVLRYYQNAKQQQEWDIEKLNL